MTLYYRHRREFGNQVPDNEGSGQSPRWIFAGDESQQYWMACEYRGTETVLARPLPRGLARCTAMMGGLRCE